MSEDRANKQRADQAFVFVGGAAWLDLVNTQVTRDGRVVDLLTSVADFSAWAVSAGLPALDTSFETESGPDHDDALREVTLFRQQLRRQAECSMAGQPAPPAFVDSLNDRLAASPRIPKLSRTPDGLALSAVLPGPADLTALLSMIAESAARYIAHSETARLKTCEHDDCILFFYDTSKNNARRWCAMATCGNRAKAKTHYARSRRAVKS